MSNIEVNSQARILDCSKSDEFFAEPVASMNFMKIAVHRVDVIERGHDGIPREHTTSAADKTTLKVMTIRVVLSYGFFYSLEISL